MFICCQQIFPNADIIESPLLQLSLLDILHWNFVHWYCSSFYFFLKLGFYIFLSILLATFYLHWLYVISFSLQISFSWALLDAVFLSLSNMVVECKIVGSISLKLFSLVSVSIFFSDFKHLYLNCYLLLANYFSISWLLMLKFTCSRMNIFAFSRVALPFIGKLKTFLQSSFIWSYFFVIQKYGDDLM